MAKGVGKRGKGKAPKKPPLKVRIDKKVKDAIENQPSKAITKFIDAQHNSYTKKINDMIIFANHYRNTRGNITQAALLTGIDRSDYYTWIAESKLFKTTIDNIQEEIIDMVEQFMLNETAKGNQALIMFFLSRKAKHRGYGEPPRGDYSGDNQKQVNTLIIEILPPPVQQEPIQSTIDIEHTEIKPVEKPKEE